MRNPPVEDPLPADDPVSAAAATLGLPADDGPGRGLDALDDLAAEMTDATLSHQVDLPGPLCDTFAQSPHPSKSLPEERAIARTRTRRAEGFEGMGGSII